MMLIIWKRVIKEKMEKIREIIIKSREKIWILFKKKVAKRWLISKKIMEKVGKKNKAGTEASCDSPQGSE